MAQNSTFLVVLESKCQLDIPYRFNNIISYYDALPSLITNNSSNPIKLAYTNLLLCKLQKY